MWCPTNTVASRHAAVELSSRRHLEFFTRPGVGDIPTARDALEIATARHGWHVGRHTDTAAFCRLIIHGPESPLVELAVDAASGNPPAASFVGPTFAPDELAGRKVIALFDRAAARDFADVYVLATCRTTQQLTRRSRRHRCGSRPTRPGAGDGRAQPVPRQRTSCRRG